MVSNYDMYEVIGHKGSGRHTNFNTWSTCTIWVPERILGYIVYILQLCTFGKDTH